MRVGRAIGPPPKNLSNFCLESRNHCPSEMIQSALLKNMWVPGQEKTTGPGIGNRWGPAVSEEAARKAPKATGAGGPEACARQGGLALFSGAEVETSKAGSGPEVAPGRMFRHSKRATKP